jgi:hypothetical protein
VVAFTSYTLKTEAVGSSKMLILTSHILRITFWNTVVLKHKLSEMMGDITDIIANWTTPKL